MKILNLGILSIILGLTLLTPSSPAQAAVPNWRAVDQVSFPSDKQTFATAISIAPNGEIFAAGEGGLSNWQPGYPNAGYVRRSSDGGKSWKTVDQFQLEAGYDTEMTAIGATSGGLVVSLSRAASTDYGTAFRPNGIVRLSNNGGKTWKTVFTKIASFEERPVADDSILFLSNKILVQMRGEIFLSSDYGVSWHPVKTPDARMVGYIADLKADGKGTVYALTMKDGVSAISTSTDFGQTWNFSGRTAVADGLFKAGLLRIDDQQNIFILAYNYSFKDSAFATKLFKGQLGQPMLPIVTYNLASTKAEWPARPTFAVDASNLYVFGLNAQSENIVQVSKDRGATWSTVNLGLTSTKFNAVANHGAVAYLAGSSESLSGPTVAYTKWNVQAMNLSTLSSTVADAFYSQGASTFVRGLAAGPAGALVMFGSAWNGAVSEEAFLRISGDFGSTWKTVRPLTPANTSTYYSAVAVSGNGTLRALLGQSSRTAGHTRVAQTSFDAGKTWVNGAAIVCPSGSSMNESTDSLAISPLGTIYASIVCTKRAPYQDMNVVFQSTDGARSFTQIGSVPVTSMISVGPLLLTPAGDLIFSIGGYSNVKTVVVRGHRAGAGTAWTFTNAAELGTDGVVATVDHLGYLYAFGDGAVYRSADGVTWESQNIPQLPAGFSTIRSLTVSVTGALYLSVETDASYVRDPSIERIYQLSAWGGTWSVEFERKITHDEFLVQGVATADGDVYFGGTSIGPASLSGTVFKR